MAEAHVIRARVYRYALPLRNPLPLPGTTLRVRTGLLLRLTGDRGGEGWGEIAPLPGFSREDLPHVLGEARSLCRRLPGRSVTADGVLDASLRDSLPPLSPAAGFGLESACLELWGREHGVSPAGMLGAPEPVSVPVNALVPSGAGIADVDALQASGYTVFKLKVGRRPMQEELSAVRALAVHVAGRGRLRLDANRAWSLSDAVRFIGGLPRESIEYVEEPLRDPSALPAFARATGAPFAVDETLVETVLRRPPPSSNAGVARDGPSGPVWAALLSLPGLRAVILKPMLLGGVGRCMAIGQEAQDNGLLPVFSSCFESGVGIGLLAALAGALGPDIACGLDPYRWLVEDIVDPPPVLRGGRLTCRACGSTSGTVNTRHLQDVTDGDDTMPAERKQ